MKTSDVWLGDGSEPTGGKEGHRVGLERATLRDGKNGATHTKRKRAKKVDENDPTSRRAIGCVPLKSAKSWVLGLWRPCTRRLCASGCGRARTSAEYFSAHLRQKRRYRV